MERTKENPVRLEKETGVKRSFLPIAASKQISLWASSTKPKLAVPQDSNMIKSWRGKIRKELKRVLKIPKAISEISTKKIEQFQHKDVYVHRIFISPPDEAGWEAIVLEPSNIKDRRPGWLCLHGCISGGASAVTGLIDKTPGGKESLKQFECDYALQLARRGYITLTFHLPGFGPRHSSRTSTSDTPVADPKLIYSITTIGKSYLGWCVCNAISALSVLHSWPTAIPNKIGVMGFSMGGTLSAMVGAIDRRVKAIALSGRFPSWRERIVRGGVGLLITIPGLIQLMDLGDIIASMAPKPLFISQEVRGNINRARKHLAGTRRAYRAFSAYDKLTIYYDNALRHRFIGDVLYQWIEKLWPI